MRKLIPIILIIFIFCSCSYMQGVRDAGMKGLLIAKSELASLAEDYEMAYQNASPIAQLSWRDKVDPLFIQADEIIQEWEFALKYGNDTATQQEKYMEIKKLIIRFLVEIEKG